MKRRHAGIIALFLAGGAATGVVAVTKTASIGQAASGASDAEIAKRKAELDRWQERLEKQLAKKPPKVVTRRTAARKAGGTAPAPAAYSASAAPVAYTTAASGATSQASRSDGSGTRHAPQKPPKTAGAKTHASEPVDTTETAAAPAPVVISAPSQQSVAVASPSPAPVTETSSSPSAGGGEPSDDSHEVEDHEEPGGGDD